MPQTAHLNRGTRRTKTPSVWKTTCRTIVCLFDLYDSSQVKVLFVADFDCFHRDPDQRKSPSKPLPPQNAFNTFATFCKCQVFIKWWTSDAADQNHNRKKDPEWNKHDVKPPPLPLFILPERFVSCSCCWRASPYIATSHHNPPLPTGFSFSLRQVLSFFFPGGEFPQKLPQKLPRLLLSGYNVGEPLGIKRGNRSAYKTMDGK